MIRHVNTESWSYLYEHLYQAALKGVYDESFLTCREQVDILKPFPSFKDYILSVERDPGLKEQAAQALKKLWPVSFETRSELGLVLLMTIWQDLPQFNLEDGYYTLFDEMGGDCDD